MIDLWKLVKQFKTGDWVQRTQSKPGEGLSAFVGKVTAVHRGLGVVDVQWPYGNDRISADELIKVDPTMIAFQPPDFDQSYSSYDIEKARKKWAATQRDYWRGNQMPAGFYLTVAKAADHGASEVEAYDLAWHKYSAQGADDETLRDEVSKLYKYSRKLQEMRIQQHVAKAATYWVAQNRQYRLTSEELKVKSPKCPKCATAMKKTTYKMAEGNRVRLFACPKDLFLIKTDSILGPQGEPIDW